MRARHLIVLLIATLSATASAQPGPAEEAAAPPAEAPPGQPPPAPDAAPTPPPPDEGLPAAAPQSAEQPPPPAAGQPMPAPPQGQPSGQWTYTNQYGWLWMPYGQQYTYISPDDSMYPSEYVYYPVYGWRWVVAPWVYGYGPQPYWGVYGPRYYVWYAHPWFHRGGRYGWGGYHGWGEYRGWNGPHEWGSHGWRDAPAYYRTGDVHQWHSAAPVSHGAQGVQGEGLGHSASPAAHGEAHGASAPSVGGERGTPNPSHMATTPPSVHQAQPQPGPAGLRKAQGAPTVNAPKAKAAPPKVKANPGKRR